MLSKKQISFIRSLEQKKVRIQEGLFVVEGEKTVRDLLHSSFEINQLYATRKFREEFISDVSSVEGETIEITEDELHKISFLSTPNQVLAVVKIPDVEFDESKVKGKLTLVIDGVNDPGNMGTLIRLADWFGVRSLLCSPDTADCFNSKVVQASMGSIFRTDVHYTDLELFLEANQNIYGEEVYASTLEGQNIYEAELSAHGLILMGNEARGIRSELKKFFTQQLFIPPFGVQVAHRLTDSLNVAIAAGIFCSEFRRRNKK